MMMLINVEMFILDLSNINWIKNSYVYLILYNIYLYII